MQILQLAEDESWDKLLELDELTRELKAERVLVGFTSLVPSFPPTFKRYRGKGIKGYYHTRRTSTKATSVDRRYSLSVGTGKEHPVRSLIVHGMGQSVRRVLNRRSVPHIGLRNRSVHDKPLANQDGNSAEESLQEPSEEGKRTSTEMQSNHGKQADSSCEPSSVHSEHQALSISKDSNDASAFDTNDYSGRVLNWEFYCNSVICSDDDERDGKWDPRQDLVKESSLLSVESEIADHFAFIRLPSYTDRILYKSLPRFADETHIKVLYFESVEEMLT